MKTIKCALVDDEPLALELLKSYVKRIPSLELTQCYSSAVEAAKLIQDPVELLFLDIQMPDLNGMEFARLLPETTRVVFITAFDKYAVEGFRVNALDYLLKPVSFDAFLGAVKKAQQWYALQENKPNTVSISDVSEEKGSIDTQDDCIFVKSDYKLHKVPFKDILYIEGLKDYVKIYLDDARKSILTLASLKSLDTKLPNRFIRIHRSFIINVDKVQMVDKGSVKLTNGTLLPTSEGFKDEFLNYLEQRTIN
jgi:DNA-binding LytR/AlgR family response regulator